MVKLHLTPQPRIIFLDEGYGQYVKIPEKETLLDALDSINMQTLNMNMVYDNLDDYKRALPEGFDPQEGYVLKIAPDCVTIYSDTDNGKYYASQTLFQVMSNIKDGNLPALEIIDWPEIKLRGAHICYHLITEFMPQLAPDFNGLIRRIRELAHFKVNHILLEIEALFPYQKHSMLPAKIAFTREQLNELSRVCKENHVKIMPLIQSIGHNYYILKHAEYSHLREISGTRQQFCITNGKTKELYFDLVDEVIDAFPDMEYFHIGADETWNLGKCKMCQKAFDEMGMESVYCDYVNSISEYIRHKGKKTVIYSDMLELFPGILDYIDRDTIIMYWNYEITEWSRPYTLKRFTEAFDVIGASGARYGTHNHTMYRFKEAMETTNMLVSESIRYGAQGFLVTDWMKAVPYELTMITLVYGGSMSWNSTGTLQEFERAFSSIYFGLDTLLFAEAMERLSKKVPYCEDAQTHQPDSIDRYDLSGLTLGERIRKFTSKSDIKLIYKGFKELTSGEAKEFDIMCNYVKTLEALKKAEKEGTEILDRLLEVKVQRNKREYEILCLSARTQVHKAKMGLLFDQCENIIKYPEMDYKAQKDTLISQLECLKKNWHELRKLTQHLLGQGTFKEVLNHTLDVKFEPEEVQYIDKYIKSIKLL